MAFKEVEVDDFGAFVKWATIGQSVTGFLVSKNETDGGFGKPQKVYSLQDGDDLIAIGGSADINRKFTRVEIGQMVRVTYVEDLPTSKGNPMRCFKVEVDDGGAAPAKKPAQVGNDDIPF